MNIDYIKENEIIEKENKDLKQDNLLLQQKYMDLSNKYDKVIIDNETLQTKIKKLFKIQKQIRNILKLNLGKI